jgi:serine phosphatase RsbU (regulator of sigma subunit)
MAATAVGRLWSGLLAAVVSFLSLGYYFASPPPMHRLTLDRPQDLIALGVFFVVALALAQALAEERHARAIAQKAQQRLKFLAEGSDLLTRASLDYGKTLSELAHLSVPRLADFCAVDIVGEDGVATTVVVAHAEPVNGALVDNLLHQDPPDPDLPSGVSAVIRTGTAEIYPKVSEEALRAIARDQRHQALLRGLRVRSLVIVPVRAGNRTVGALTFGVVRRGRRYAPEDVDLIEELASRAGTALENVWLYEERTRVARMLQQSLLPNEVPTVEGLEIVVRFHPLGEGHLVGGDFYDVFESDGNGIAVVVGDVCGKGIEAAALTGLARHTLRAAAIRERAPGAILRSLNEAVVRQRVDRYCTVVYGRLDREGTHLTLCSGGHPLPMLLRRDGTVETIGAPGTLLGVFDDPDLFDVTVKLEPDDVVLLYTDGLLDEHGPAPEEELRTILETCKGMTAEQIADTLEKEVIGESRRHDDIAMVVFRVRPKEPQPWERGGGEWRST